MRVSLLGTGIMGSPMARNIASAGHDVVVWNRTRETAEATGLELAGSPADAARGADAVVTTLTDADAVEQVIRDALPVEGVWVQMSTVGLECDRLAALAAEAGIAFVDAPVVGTKEPAERGELIVLASGPDEVLDLVAPLFDAIGRRTLRLGDAGRGSRFKLVVNSWLLTLVEGLAETIALAETLGFRAEDFLAAIDGGPLDVPYAQLKGKQMAAREYPPSFPVRLALKDARLVVRAAANWGVELPFAEAAAARMQRALDEGHGDEDMAAVAEVARP